MGRSTRRALALASHVALSSLLFACSRVPADATPEGTLRAWIDKMESGSDDPGAMKEAFDLLGPSARTNLSERAERASRGQGRRYEPYEMLASGRFALNFRPKSMHSRVAGDRAVIEVRGEGPEELALVPSIREGHGWRLEPDLPELTVPLRNDPPLGGGER